MRSSRLFWGVIILVLGSLLLLRSLGIINWNIWLIFWPALLIAAGAWMLLGSSIRKGDVNLETTSLDYPLENAQEAVLDINHGAGTLDIGGSAPSGKLLQGTFAGGVESRLEKIGNGVSLTMQPPTNVVWSFPIGNEGFRWNFRLTDAVPLDMRLHTGAGETHIDLTKLQVKKLRLETGASSSTITLPANAGYSEVTVIAGAASVVLKVPAGVAGRITMKSGLVGTKIDASRFPFNGDTYESPDYASAANKIQILVEAGVGSIEIISA